MNAFSDTTPKTVLVTGASGHLGAAVCQAFNQAGYKVIGVGHHTADASQLKIASYFQADLASEAEVGDLFRKITSRFPQLSGAVFLSGGFAPGNLESTDIQLFDKMIRLNFLTAFLPARELIAHLRMQGKGGRILFTSSGPGTHPNLAAGSIAYGLSKSLLNHFSQIIQSAFSGDGIQAAVVVPTTLDTEVNRLAMPRADRSDWMTPERVANLMVRYMEGQVEGAILIP